MARGQSPFQGQYTVPIADFSGIERAGAAWGDAFKGIGQQVGGAIKERKVLKGKLKGYQKSVESLEEMLPYLLEGEEVAEPVKNRMKELRQMLNASSDMNLREKVAAYEQYMPTVNTMLSLGMQKTLTDKKYPPLPVLGRPPDPSASTVPDPSSLLPTPTQPQVPTPASPDPSTLNQVTPSGFDRTRDPLALPTPEEIAAIEEADFGASLRPPTPTPDIVPDPRVPDGVDAPKEDNLRDIFKEDEIKNWAEFEESGKALERSLERGASPKPPEGFDSWEEYNNVQQMELWDQEEGQEGGKGVRGATFSQPLLTPDESISRELANRAGIKIPTKSLREPPALTPDEEYKLNQLLTDPRFFQHPQGARAFGPILEALQAKQKAHSEFPQTQIEHWTKLVNLSGSLLEMDRESKMPDLSDSGVRAKYIEEESAVYDALGMDATFSWSGGKLAVSIKGVEGAKEMIPLRIKKADGTYDSVPGMYHIEGSSVLHIMDAETGTLVKPTSPEELSKIAFNNVNIWKTVMENIRNTEPVSDIKSLGGVLGESRSMPINFLNFDSMLGTIMRSVTTDEEFARKDFGEKLIKGEFGEGGRREKGWEIKNGVLEYWTKRGEDTINWQIPIDASFKTGVDEWVKYHNSKKGIAGITTAIQLQNGQRGGGGDRGIRGETGIPEFPNNPIQFPRRSYNREEILEQIRK